MPDLRPLTGFWDTAREHHADRVQALWAAASVFGWTPTELRAVFRRAMPAARSVSDVSSDTLRCLTVLLLDLGQDDRVLTQDDLDNAGSWGGA